MATIDWQKPPFFSRVLGRFGRQGSFDIVHDPTIPGIHEGEVSVKTVNKGLERYGGLYWSKYEFQVKPDNPSETGPWQVGLLFDLAGVLSKSKVLCSARAILACRAKITRIQDGATIYSKLLRDRAGVGIFGSKKKFLDANDYDFITINAEEHKLDLVTYASVHVKSQLKRGAGAKLWLQSPPVGVKVTLFL